jgi:hypothetical protein
VFLVFHAAAGCYWKQHEATAHMDFSEGPIWIDQYSLNDMLLRAQAKRRAAEDPVRHSCASASVLQFLLAEGPRSQMVHVVFKESKCVTLQAGHNLRSCNVTESIWHTFANPLHQPWAGFLPEEMYSPIMLTPILVRFLHTYCHSSSWSDA